MIIVVACAFGFLGRTSVHTRGNIGRVVFVMNLLFTRMLFFFLLFRRGSKRDDERGYRQKEKTRSEADHYCC